LIMSAIAAMNLADIGKTRLRRNRHHTRDGND
jgi:hypothetical protein